MDVEKLKKLNQLTKELQRHSLAFNSDEAFKQAGKVFEETQQELNQIIKEENSIQAPVQINSVNTSNKNPNETQFDFLIQKKIEFMLEMNNKKFAEEIQNLRLEVSNLNLQLKKIQNDLQNNTKPEISAHTKESVQNTVATQQKQEEYYQEQPQVKENVQEKPKDPHPRQGNYKPGDVSIEKMFYYGNKSS